MLFRDVLVVSALLASVSASTIHPLLAVRQNLGQCQSQCALIVQKQPDIQSGACSLSCICTDSFINALSTCLSCEQAAGQTLTGIPPDYAQQLVTSCDAAGFPVTAGSSGSGSSSGSSGSSGSGGTGSSSGTGNSGLGGSSSTTAKSSTSTSTSGGGGISIGKSAAMGLSANMGIVAAVVTAGMYVLIA